MRQLIKVIAVALAASVFMGGAAKADYTTECPYFVTDVAYNDVLNIRAWPSARSRIVGFIPPDGRGVILIRWKGNWGRISYEGVEGWAHMNYLRADCH